MCQTNGQTSLNLITIRSGDAFILTIVSVGGYREYLYLSLGMCVVRTSVETTIMQFKLNCSTTVANADSSDEKHQPCLTPTSLGTLISHLQASPTKYSSDEALKF